VQAVWQKKSASGNCQKPPFFRAESAKNLVFVQEIRLSHPLTECSRENKKRLEIAILISGKTDEFDWIRAECANLGVEMAEVERY
jgi:hypothetical protein